MADDGEWEPPRLRVRVHVEDVNQTVVINCEAGLQPVSWWRWWLPSACLLAKCTVAAAVAR